MDLPVMPPVEPMLAKAAPSIPVGHRYEPKWDGFRAIVYRDAGEVEIGSRNTRPMQRYFPEIVESALADLPDRCVVDGEIVVPSATSGGLDFEALQARIHPAASRVLQLSRETPALLVVFDLLALGDADLTERPFAQRRATLEDAIGLTGPVYLTPSTDDHALAGEWFSQFEGAGLDGVVAKRPDDRYQPGRRVMTKIKHERTADCVVAGYRPHASGPNAVGSLLLGLWTTDGTLAAVGVAAAFPMSRRRELVSELAPYVTGLVGHPWGLDATGRTPREGETSRWNAGKDLSFVPLRPELVVEVAYDHLEGDRFRHTTQFRRWRPDRDPESCTYGQLEEPVGFALADVLAAR